MGNISKIKIQNVTHDIKDASAYVKPSGGIPASDIASGVIPDVSSFITKSVNDLTNYYLKSETYTKTEVGQLIGAINQFKYEIAASTSAVTSPASNVLYLIGPTGSGADKYEEYVYPNSTIGFVKIGDTSIDLSGYVTEEVLNIELEKIWGSDAPTFGGLQIASGPLSYENGEYVIKDSWNHDSYNSIYGKNNGSTYFNFIEMGQLFEKSDFSTSDGDINNLLDPLNGWRLPSINEWTVLICYDGVDNTDDRPGSTVNGIENAHRVIIQLTGIEHAGSENPEGMLLFPDGKTITGCTLEYIDDISFGADTDITLEQLNVYLAQGCVFLPCSGLHYEIDDIHSSSVWYTNGSYLSSQSDSNNNASAFSFAWGDIYIPDSIRKTTGYNSIRLVKSASSSPSLKDEIDSKYEKPSSGIPATDLASAVQTSLGKADTALQSFTETDPTVPAWAKASSKPSYSYSEISGTPSLGTAAAKNVAASGNASTTEVVMGNDTRLTDARNAADVYSWAKAASKPSYSYSEITDKPTIQTLSVSGTKLIIS